MAPKKSHDCTILFAFRGRETKLFYFGLIIDYYVPVPRDKRLGEKHNIIAHLGRWTGLVHYYYYCAQIEPWLSVGIMSTRRNDMDKRQQSKSTLTV